MLDIQKQIKYWIDNAQTDIETAELLITNNKLLHGLFFCHLAIEKALKAHVVKSTSEIPPKSHNLLFLAEKAQFELPKETEIFLGILMKYQIEGRYPDYKPEIPVSKIVTEYLEKTKDLFSWLKKKL